MNKILVLMLFVALMLVGCEKERKEQGVVSDSNSKCVIEKVEYPFGKWEISDEIYCWDSIQNETYYVFRGDSITEKGIYQYTVFAYDLINNEWEEFSFDWNQQLEANQINMLGNYQEDNNGNIYFLGAEMQTEGSRAEAGIYRIDATGNIIRMEVEGREQEERNVRSFQRLENDKFLVAVEIGKENRVECIDFVKQEISETELSTAVDNMIALNVLCVVDDKIVYPYAQDEHTCLVQFRKYSEKVPEKIVSLEYDFSEEEIVYSWNIGKSREGDTFLFTSKGIWQILKESAKQKVSETELSPIFDKYQDVINVVQIDDNEYFCVVQNEEEIGMFREMILN